MLRPHTGSRARAEACETLIVRCLRDLYCDRPARTEIGALAEQAIELLPDVAAHHRVAPAVRCALRPGQLPPEVDGRMSELERGVRLRHLTAIADLAWLQSTLGAHAGDWAVFKGPILSEVIYRRPDLRSYSDIDVLVRPRAFEQILDDLVAGGAVLVDVNWNLIRSSRRAELSLLLPAGNLLDLHWHLVNHEADRRQFRLHTDDVLVRSREVQVGPVGVPTFDPTDTLVHLALHAAMEGGHRLVWSLDIAEAALSPGIDWDLLISRSAEWGVQLPVGVMLRRSASQLDAPSIPAEVVQELLRGSWWPQVVRTAEVLRPPPHSSSPPPLSLRSITASTRASSLSSSRQLVRRALAELTDPRHPWRSGSAQQPLQNPLHQPVEGAADEHAYLAYVATQR